MGFRLQNRLESDLPGHRDQPTDCRKEPDIAIESSNVPKARDFQHHPRDWRGFHYVYPVISRRSGGISIGINLNPDMACNFDCIYCQVDRSVTPRVREVDIGVLRDELEMLLTVASDGRIFTEPEFADTPDHLRRLNDIAFSGDGEPTTCPLFPEAVEVVAELKRRHGCESVKTVLITDACYLTKPKVESALRIMDDSNGEVWAKLDAGTERYYKIINKPNYPLSHVIDNIVHTARSRPVTIQSLFMRVNGQPPPPAEITAFADRLNEMSSAGAELRLIQIYTVARTPAQDWVASLSREEVDTIADVVRRRTGLSIETYY